MTGLIVIFKVRMSEMLTGAFIVQTEVGRLKLTYYVFRVPTENRKTLPLVVSSDFYTD